MCICGNGYEIEQVFAFARDRPYPRCRLVGFLVRFNGTVRRRGSRLRAVTSPRRTSPDSSSSPSVVVIELWEHSGIIPDGFQVSISVEDEGGYRIFGPKFIGQSRLIRSYRLSVRDMDEIRHYLDKMDPRGGN